MGAPLALLRLPARARPMSGDRAGLIVCPWSGGAKPPDAVGQGQKSCRMPAPIARVRSLVLVESASSTSTKACNSVRLDSLYM